MQIALNDYFIRGVLANPKVRDLVPALKPLLATATLRVPADCCPRQTVEIPNPQAMAAARRALAGASKEVATKVKLALGYGALDTLVWPGQNISI